jgi:[acyl-carrier-protein] S-malonyltransferase
MDRIMKTAFIFPGQGAQIVAMGKDIASAYPQAMEIFNKANSIVGYDLMSLCFEGPGEKLNTTTISQPAIYTTSAAILEVIKQNHPSVKPDITAGLSLGEYTALYAAGAVSFEDGLRLVQKRGEAMQQAADSTDGTMVSIIGLDEDKIKQLCDEAGQGEVLAGVNFNCPGQVVISGKKSACERAEKLAEKYGAMKAIRLEVAGAFHSELMLSAAETLTQALSKCNINEPKDVKVIANFNADYYLNSASIRAGLIKQLTSAVYWQKCMERLIADGVEKFYEIGPQRVLTGLMKRINRKMEVINVSSLEAVNGSVK